MPTLLRVFKRDLLFWLLWTLPRCHHVLLLSSSLDGVVILLKLNEMQENIVLSLVSPVSSLLAVWAYFKLSFSTATYLDSAHDCMKCPYFSLFVLAPSTFSCSLEEFNSHSSLTGFLVTWVFAFCLFEILLVLSLLLLLFIMIITYFISWVSYLFDNGIEHLIHSVENSYFADQNALHLLLFTLR